jgi:hypothetical protein
MTAPPRPHGSSWGTRFLAALGFFLAAGVVGLGFSGQIAMAKAQDYLRTRYHAPIEIPVRRIRPDFLTGPTATGEPLPPLGFCWTVELDAGSAEAEVSISPWTHEVVDWEAEF